MGDGMKFTLDEIKTILQALYEMKGMHCYNHYEDNYEWEQSFEKRWADEIDAIIKRFNKSAERKVEHQYNLKKAEHLALENLKVGQQLTVKHNAREDLMRFIDIIKEKWDVVMELDSDGWKVRRVT